MTDYVPLGTVPRTHALVASMANTLARRQNLPQQPVSAPPALDGGQADDGYRENLDTGLHLAKLGAGADRFTEPLELDGPDPRDFPGKHVRVLSADQRARTTRAQTVNADVDTIAAPRRSSDVMGPLPAPEYDDGQWNHSGADFNAADAASGAGTNKPRLIRFA